jgi:peptide/nickel transport system substrate-binding protein
MGKRRQRVAASIGVGIVLGLILQGPAIGQDTSPSAAESPSAADEKVTFRWGTTNDIDSFNPLIMVESPAYTTAFLTYDILVNFGQEDPSQPSPGLAASWESSEDGLTWTFHLRENAEWHDGVPLTSGDVKYTFDRMIAEDQGCCVDYLPFIEEIGTPDEHTVTITTSRPTVQMLSIWVHILPEHIWKDVTTKEADTFENFPSVGSGAFKAVEWEVGQFWRLEANPDYWGWDVYGNGEPGIDEIIFEVFNNQDAMIEALKNGEIDYAANMSASLFDSLENEPNIDTLASVPTSFVNLVLNVDGDHLKRSEGHPALGDVRVRQAIAYAVDQQTAVERILRGYGQVGYGVIAPYIGDYHFEPSPEEAYTYDPARANQILDDAGYLDTDGDGVREMPGGGEPVELDYFTRTEDPDTLPLGELIEGWLEEVGIGVTVRPVNDTKLGDIVYYGEFDMNTWGWGVEPNPDFMLSVFTCGQRPEAGIWNETFYCDEGYDQMYLDQKTLIDPAERAELVKEMQRKLYLEVPEVVLYYYNFLEAWRTDKFTGFVHQPTNNGAVVDQYGIYTFLNLQLKSEAGPAPGDETKGIAAGVWVGILAVIAVIVIGVIIVRRRGEESRI